MSCIKLMDGSRMQSTTAEIAGADADCVVIVTDHKNVDYEDLVNRAKLIVDTRNAVKSYDSANIVRL